MKRAIFLSLVPGAIFKLPYLPWTIRLQTSLLSLLQGFVISVKLVPNQNTKPHHPDYFHSIFTFHQLKMHPSPFSRLPNQGFKHIIFKGAFWKWGLTEVNYADPQDYYSHLSQDGIMANPKAKKSWKNSPRNSIEVLRDDEWVEGRIHTRHRWEWDWIGR